ncbi:MAG: hypothetical protein M1840_001442 [Geoglossum simile]|nr:MAG: hypothetical protein M1840_001442 [Geoglossum simile]
MDTVMLERVNTLPTILLKTNSTPTDGYEEYFRSAQTPDGAGFEPVFVPVLEHRYDQGNLGEVVRLVRDGGFAGEGGDGPRRHGGLWKGLLVLLKLGEENKTL